MYHINPKGNPGVCQAREKCPFGNSFNHFVTQQEARESYEKLMEARNFYKEENITFHDMQLSPKVEKVLEDIRAVGNPLIVGGSVRDSFSGAESKDIDIEVHNAKIDDIADTLRGLGYSVDEVGKQFGVLKVSKKGVISDLDISVPRLENKTGHGHQSFEVEMREDMTVKEAAERRDFTFNAMMYDPKRKMLIDPFNGKSDFENRIIRHVSDKFEEDPLRVLRAVQFAGRFKMSIDENTAELCRKLRKEYDNLSSERVQMEWEKLYTKSENIKYGLNVLQKVGWDDTFPGLKHALSFDLGKLINSARIEDEKELMYPAIIASFMKETKDSESFIKGTVLGSDSQKIAISLWETDSEKLNTEYDVRRYAKDARKGFTFERYGVFSNAIWDNKGRYVARLAGKIGVDKGPEPDFILGRDVLPIADRAPGEWLGKLLNVTREEQYKRSISSKDEALAFAKEWLKNN